VALRPLGVGELLDGAVATLRRDPGPMLGLSAVVAVVSTVLQLVATYVFVRDVAVIEDFGPEMTGDQLVSTLSDSLWLFVAAVVLGFLSTVLLTGVLTVVVGRAVLGQRMGVSAAWRAARPRLLKLAGLTLLFGLVVSLPLLAATLLTAAAGAPAGVVAAVAVVLILAAVPLTVWVYVRFALATPAFMLETTSAEDGRTRPATVLGSLQRSAGLVRGAWWRTFGILLLALVITVIVSQVLSVPAALPALFGGPFVADDGTPTLFALVIQGIAGVLATTVTAPFTAALTVLLYVDRRIRREGLDIELARAAGVRIPGRTDAGPPRPPGA
jgi:MFS family permease